MDGILLTHSVIIAIIYNATHTRPNMPKYTCRANCISLATRLWAATPEWRLCIDRYISHCLRVTAASGRLNGDSKHALRKSKNWSWKFACFFKLDLIGRRNLSCKLRRYRLCRINVCVGPTYIIQLFRDDIYSLTSGMSRERYAVMSLLCLWDCKHIYRLRHYIKHIYLNVHSYR